LGAVSKLLAVGTVNLVPSFAVISPTGFLRRFMPGRVTAHGMSSSVIVFAGPCVMMRCGGGSAFGSGSFAGGGGCGGCCAGAAPGASSAAAITSVRASDDDDRERRTVNMRFPFPRPFERPLPGLA
jgi:hypothetical protein